MDDAGFPPGTEHDLAQRVARLEELLTAQRGEMAVVREEIARLRDGSAVSSTLSSPARKPQSSIWFAEPPQVAPTPALHAAPETKTQPSGTVEAAGERPTAYQSPPYGHEFPGPAAGQAQAKRSLENRIGSQWFNRVGILALLIGVAWFLKLAYDNGWIRPSPLGKTVTGLLVGAAVVLWSERFRRKGYGAFSYSLKAVGTGTLYLTLWAAFHLYALLPAPVALAMMVGVTLWNGVMAWTQDAELLAVYALVGGFATPPLLGSGGNHEVFLFTYTLAMDVMVLLLVWKKPWQRLLLGSFPGTVTFFIAWYSRWFTADAAGVTAVFVVLLAAPFIGVALAGRQREGVLEGLLTPLAGAAFLSLAMYSVLQDSGRHAWLPWMAVALAATYLLLMRVRGSGSGKGDAARQGELAEAVHLTLAIVFLTIAIPLKAEGRCITVGWLAEGVALLWVSARVLGPDVQSRVRSVMRWLGCVALTLGVGQTLVLWDWREHHAFRNAHFATEIFAAAMLALAAWIARGARDAGNETVLRRTPSWASIANVTTLVAHLFAGLGTAFEISRAWGYNLVGGSGYNAADAGYHSILSTDCQGAFLMAYGAALLAWVVLRSRPGSGLLRGLAYVYVGLGYVLLLGTLVSEDSTAFTAFFNLRLLLELLGATAVAAAAWLTWRERAAKPAGVKVAGIGVIAFNLLMLLAVTREIATYFSGAGHTDAGLAESATISGWLMVYAAVLLAAGFWKRLAFVRWQGLVLIVFTIAKVFLYDMRNLSSGYRVLSFLGLGVLLMGVSFAYQKDWLGLRDADPADEVKP